jgi:hypothetical protein
MGKWEMQTKFWMENLKEKDHLEHRVSGIDWPSGGFL